MNKLFVSILFLVFLFISISAQNVKVSGVASKGGKIVRTSANVQHTLMETYPTATVTVYLTGTLTLATIFSDEAGTPKSNPFTANTDASWYFYVVEGRYDIRFSGTGILVPFTLSDIFVIESGGGGSSGVTSFNGRTGVVVPQALDYNFNDLDFSGSNFNSIFVRSASDLNAGTLPDARFPATLPAISGINLTNLNASNITSGTIDDARLSTNVPLKNTSNTFSANNFFVSSVGIGTITPRRRLDVLDASNPQLRLSLVDNTTYTDFAVDSGGTLTITPTGNISFDATGNQINPLNNFDQNLGQINKKYLTLHAAELFVETLVAQNTIATIGGRILVAPSNILIADLSSAATIINVKYNNLNNGDRLYMEGNNSVEFFAVTSGASVVPGGFSYSITRNLDGTGANDWFAGDALVNTGVSGNGFIDLYSIRGVKSSTQLGPTIVGNVRNSTTFNDWTERWAIGNLNGLYGYGSDTYGAAFGVPAGSWIKIDPTNGIRIGNNITTKISLDASGNASFVGSITAAGGTIGGWAITSNTLVSSGITLTSSATPALNKISVGTGNYNNIDTAFYVDGDGKFSLKDKLSWNGTTLTIQGNIEISSLIGKLTLSGASSAIAVGNPPPTSASVGTGIWIDRTGMYGLASNVLQAKFSAADGKISAGSSAVVLDADGVRIAQGDGNINKLKYIGSFSTNIMEIFVKETNTSTLSSTINTNTSGMDTNGSATASYTVTNDSTDIAVIASRVYGTTHATKASQRFISLGANNGVLVHNGSTHLDASPSTALEISSTTGAVLFPRMSTGQRDALTAVDGMVIYNITLSKLQVRSGGAWADLH